MGLTENEDGNRFKVMIHFQPSHLDAEQAEALPRMIHTIFNLKEVFDGGQGSAGDWVDHEAWYEIYDDAHTVYSMFEDLSACMGIPLNPVLYNPCDDEEEAEPHDCPDCDGTGYAQTERAPCPSCGGSGIQTAFGSPTGEVVQE